MSNETIKQWERTAQEGLSALKELAELHQQLLARVLGYQQAVATAALEQARRHLEAATKADSFQALVAAQAEATRAGAQDALERVQEAARLTEQARAELFAWVEKNFIQAAERLKPAQAA